MTRSDFLGALDWNAGETVLAPEVGGPGSWVGGPSAVNHDGVLYLAYRLRRPVGEGRGFANVIARSVDGVHLETLAVIDRERHHADSLERPCLVRTDHTWRLYLSCATPGSKHWRVDLLEAESVEELPDAVPVTVLPGDARTAVKDPVILRGENGWQLWASCHPLDDSDATDRMTTEYAISGDGIDWTWHGTALAGRPGTWDARGVRFSAVLPLSDGVLALYDGRASEAENWEERTGAALADSTAGPWIAADAPVFSSPFGSGGLRYFSAVADPGGGTRIHYEGARPDGSHELRTQLLPPDS
ncbi:hypothetical protein ABIB25_005476 [Nakamurella sp. UYEF19]|uniref:hypothetical protein n=1 Tax=Nakamurella sp. UYEF19 TaxID=1756392 RepID=UPI0033961B09